MENRFRTLIKDTFIFAAGNIGSKLILFFLVPFYTAYMTKEQYGTADLIFTVAELVLPFVSVVIFDAVLRFGLSKDERPEDVLLAAVTVLAAGSAAALLITPLYGFYPPIAPWRRLLTLYIILSGFYSVNMNYLKAKDKNVRYAVISLISTALMAALNILLIAVYRMGAGGYIAASVISMAVVTALSAAAGNIPGALRRARSRPKLLRDMLKYSAPLILNNISWWVVHSSDKIMVERMIGAQALGLYTVSAKIPALINVMTNIFTQAWGISSVKEYENTNDTEFYSSVFNAYSFVCFGAAIALIAVTKPFMRIYVGAEFYESWRYVPILLAAAAFASTAYFYGSLYGALKKSGRNMATTLLAAVTNLAVNYIGIKLAGVYGAAIGTLAAYIAMSAARMKGVGRFIRIKINMPRFVTLCLLVIMQAVFVTLGIYGAAVSAVTAAAAVVMYRGTIAAIGEKLARTLRKAATGKH